MRKFITAVMILTLICGFSANIQAQEIGFNGIGGSLGFVDADLIDGTLIFGVHADLGEITENLKIAPSIDYFTKNDVNFFSFNGNVKYYFPTNSEFSFFAGGGLGFVRVSVDEETITNPFTGQTQTVGGGSNTEIAINLLGGADFPVSENMIATGQLTYVTEGDQIKITAGLTFLLNN